MAYYFLDGISFGPACSAAVVSLPMVTPASKRDWIEPFQSFGFTGIDHTLYRWNFVSGLVIAVRICHVLPPKAIHFASL